MFNSSSKQHYYVMSRFMRYYMTAIMGFSAIFLLAMGITKALYMLIVFAVICDLTFYPYLTFVVCYRNFKVSSEGLYITNYFNPFKPNLIPWHTIQRISPEYHFYHIITTDGNKTASFLSTLERFDQFLEEFRSRRIPIDPKQQTIMNSPLPADLEGQTVGLLSSSSTTKLRVNRAWILVVCIGVFLVLFSVGLFGVAALIFVSLSLIIGLFMVVTAMTLLSLSVHMVYSAFNGYILIKAEGVDFPKPFGRRHVNWSELHYARVIEYPLKNTVKQECRFYARNEDDYFETIGVDSEAFEAIARELQVHRIPLLKETETLS